MKEVIYRKDEIVNLCRGKTVLHLGFVQHADLYEKKIIEMDWLHEKIAHVSSRLVGVDFIESAVDSIRREYGYECYSADVTSHRFSEVLSGKFDVVVCGELIEHLENPGKLLEYVKEYMTNDSTIIITTPNPWSKERVKLIKNGKLEPTWLNKEHMMWFSYQTLTQILERTGFEEVKYGFYFGESFVDYKDKYSFFEGLFRKYKRIISHKMKKEWEYDGLFFIAKTRVGS